MPMSSSKSGQDAYLEQQETILGNLFNEGRYQAVEASLQGLLPRFPDWGAGWKMLGYCQMMTGQYPMAIQVLLKALSLLGSDADVCNALATLYRAIGELAAAITFYSKAIKQRPVFPEAYNNLGGALMLKGDVDAAISVFSTAIAQNPQYPEAHHNLGNALLVKGRRARAVVAYREAWCLRPEFLEPLSMACHQQMHCVQWGGLTADIERLRQQARQTGWQGTAPFVFLTLPGTSREEQRACAQEFAQRQYGAFMNRAPLYVARESNGRKLRIGYLSSDFHEHATSYLLAGVIENHDRERFEIHAYSYGPDDQSLIRRRMQEAVTVFRDIRSLGHEQAAKCIADDAIDILVDLKGFTENARPEISALRPAPVVVNWLGYPGTLGHARLADYIIGDTVVTPLAHAGEYSEALALMPGCYQPNDRARVLGAVPSRKDASLPDAGFVFCSFNQAYKITPDVFDDWCQLLKEADGSVLWLLDPGVDAVSNLRREALARGVIPDRLIFAPKLPLSEHLGRLQLADLALDTYPCTSHTTGSDALWAGVPLVTRIGDTFASRVAASLLHAVEMPELVTHSREAYRELVLSLCRQPEKLAVLKTRLVEGRQTCVLFDTSRFTGNLERLYTLIWQQYRKGSRDHICLPDAEDYMKAH